MPQAVEKAVQDVGNVIVDACLMLALWWGLYMVAPKAQP